MIKIEKTEVTGWEPAIRGMRNPMNSWDRSDSIFADLGMDDLHYINGACAGFGPISRNASIGQNDHDLMTRLAKNGSVHAKYRRMITVYADITAPIYWLAELDTYKVGTVRNSCSFMHKGISKSYTIDDFSIKIDEPHIWNTIITQLNILRDEYLRTKDPNIFQEIRCLMPQGYMQKSTYMFNYEVLANIYPNRKDHKLDEWREFCKWIESLPYSELITGTVEEK